MLNISRILLQMAACSKVHNWYVYISASLVTFLGGILVLGLTRFAMFVYFRRSEAGWKELNDSFSSSNPGSSPTQRRFSMFSRARAAGKYILSGDPWWSKTLVSGN